ncbi:MAG TPA: aspartate carbamoyltransferase regulatory subunit [Myxococcales bacterium]
MTGGEKHLLIPKIEDGIVIDHIPSGFGLRILEVIHRYAEMTSTVGTVGLNYTSSKLGKKDMIKLSAEELPAPVLQHISMVCPGVTIKRIKNYQVDKKFTISLPDVMIGLARCRNPSCVTHHERDVVTRFRCVDAASQRYKCAFCERIFALKELEIIA